MTTVNALNAVTESASSNIFNTTLAEPLIEACSEGRFKDVQALLESGADPNTSVEELGRNGVRKVLPLTATFRVLARGDSLPKLAQRQAERIIAELVKSGAAIRQVEREVLTHSVRMGMPQMLEFLVSHGARIQRYGHELMEIAILQTKLDCVNRLKILGIDPNIRDQWGSTVFLDICSGKLQIQVQNVNDYKANPLEWFRKRMLELIEVGVNIDNTDQIGATGLMRSILSKQDLIMRALLDKGADLKIVMRNGVGAVHLAAASGSLSRLEQVMQQVSDRSQIYRFVEQTKILRLQPDIKAHLSRMAYS